MTEKDVNQEVLFASVFLRSLDEGILHESRMFICCFWFWNFPIFSPFVQQKKLRLRVPGDGEIRRWPWRCHVLRSSHSWQQQKQQQQQEQQEQKQQQINFSVWSSLYFGEAFLFDYKIILFTNMFSYLKSTSWLFAHSLDIYIYTYYKANARMALAQYLHIIWAG